MIAPVNILKHPCHDTEVRQICTDSSADCSDNALKNCSDNNFSEDGEKCLIKASDSSSVINII